MTNIIIEELDKQLEEIKNRKLFVEELFKHRSFYNFRAVSTTSADIEIPCFEEKNIIENKLLNINFNKINFKILAENSLLFKGEMKGIIYAGTFLLDKNIFLIYNNTYD